MTAFAPAGQRSDRERSAIDAEPADRFAVRLAETLAQAGAWGLAGALAGLVGLGVGARVSMRLVALSSGAIGTGVRPESGAVPGEFTADGTMFLVLAGTVIGVVIAVVLGVALGRWLPKDGRRRTVLVWALGSSVPALGLIDPNNVDFVLFGPAWFALLLFATCAVGYGGLLTVVVRRTLRPADRRARLAWIAVGVPSLGLALMASAGLGTAGLGIPLLALFALLLLPHGGKLRWWWGERAQRIGQVGLVGVGALAVCWIVVRAGRILLA